MISKRLAKYVFLCTLLGVLIVPAVAFGAEGAAGVTTMADAVKTLGAAMAMGISALAAGYAQARIGSAGQGTLAERPEERVFVLTLTALPEVIVLLGFVMAILLNG
jgi:V/A-type H+/Na+-transporting ATPase subunit K